MEMRLGLSQKAAKRLGLRKRRKISPAAGHWLRDWRVEYLDEIHSSLDYYLVMNQATLMSWLVPVEASECAAFNELLYAIVAKGCEWYDLKMPASLEIEYVQMNDRSAIGSMKELIYHAYGQLEGAEFQDSEISRDEVEHYLQRIPMGALQYDYPIERFNRNWKLLGIQT